MKTRCAWVTDNPVYIQYHDEEWGVSVHDDQKMFEFFILETFQAGLSWITILNKRENFRKAFDQFDFLKIAKYDDLKVESLLMDAGIIRNKAKINAAVNNANKYLEIQNEFGSFCDYLWGFIAHKKITNSWEVNSEVPATTALSDEISKDLKNRGFKFVGSTTIYAHLQAAGLINDHLTQCFRYKEV